MNAFKLTLTMLALSAGTASAQDVLVFGPGGELSRPYFGAVGSVTVADAAMWSALTTAEFQSYDLIWIEGNNCATTDVQALARTTQSAWAPAIDGRLMFMTGDIDFHANRNDQRARDYVGHVVGWLTDAPGTALMLNTGCTAQGSAPASAEQWRPVIGAELTQASRDNYNGTIVEEGHPLMAGFSVADMAWGNSCHGSIGSFPPGFASVYRRSPTDHCIIVRDAVECANASQCDDGSSCTEDSCVANACVFSPVAAGTPCEGGVCTPGAVCAPVDVTITRPDGGSTTGNATPTITGTATPGVTVTVRVDGELVGTTTAGPDGTWSMPTSTPLMDGPHRVTASVSTSNGDAMDASTFTIDTETGVAITSPADGGTTLDATPNIRGTGAPGATVVVTLDGAVIGTATVGADGQWFVPVSEPLANGTYDVEATSTDAAGNTTSDASTFTVDSNTAVTITSPANGSSTTDTTPTITGTAAPGAMVVVTIEIGGETRELGTVTADGEGNWSIDVAEPLPDGMLTATATATAPGGSTGADESTFTVDSSTTMMISDVDPTGRVTGIGEPGSTVVVTVNGVEVGTTTVGEDGTWAVDIDPLAPGIYEVTATGTDRAGNTASDTTSVTVTMGDDGGVVPDAGIDGGWMDGGVGADGGASTDGGVGADAGVLEGSYRGGALCAASEGASDAPTWFMLVVVGVLSRRRSRR